VHGAQDAIAPAARIAALATVGCCIVVGVVLAVAMIGPAGCDELQCQQEAAAAALTIMAGASLVVFGAVVGVHVIRRPLDNDGEQGWFWGLGVVFFLTSIGVAVLVPTATCPQGGSPDLTLGLCLSGRDRLPMSSWLWLERSIVAAGAVGAVLLATRRRLVWANVIVVVGAFGVTLVVASTSRA
jgi:hypothetical protein